MDKQLRKRLLDNAIHHVCIARTGYGDKTFAPLPLTMSCLNEEKVTKVRNLQGETVISMRQLYFDGFLSVGSDDEFTFETVQYPIQALSRFRGLKAGTGTTVVYL